MIEADTEFYHQWMITTQQSHDAALPVLAVAEKVGHPTQADTGLDELDAIKNVLVKVDRLEEMGS